MIVGNSGVGKTWSLLRFTNYYEWPAVTRSTVGIDYRTRALSVDSRRIKLTVGEFMLLRVLRCHPVSLLSDNRCGIQQVKSDLELLQVLIIVVPKESSACLI